MAATKADPKKVHVAHQWKHGSPLIACCFSPDGKYVFTSGQDYALQRWEIPSGKKVEWKAHDSWVRDIVFLHDGRTMITAGCDDNNACTQGDTCSEGTCVGGGGPSSG